MDRIEHDKTFAVLSAVNNPGLKFETSELLETDNLIHESGKLQLNTYQSFIRDLMNPRSDLRALLMVHMTGTGKTISALATATEYVRQYQPSRPSSVSNIIILGFTKDIFKKEILSHPEFDFVTPDEVDELDDLAIRMNDSPESAERYANAKNKLQRRLSKRNIKGIYQFYGYKQFASRVINMEDVERMMEKHKAEDGSGDLSADIVRRWVASGDVRMNMGFIRSLSHSLFVCDEVHNLYKSDVPNTYGVAIQAVLDYFFVDLPTNDIDSRSVRALMLSATPLTSTATEIVPLIHLLTGEALEKRHLFESSGGVECLTAAGQSKIRAALAGRVSYIMDDNPKEYPTSSFVGESVRGIPFLRFIRTYPTGLQKESLARIAASADGTNDAIINADNGGTSMIKDITFPATPAHPDGVIYSRNVRELADLPKETAVHRGAGGYVSNIFAQKILPNYSSKYAEMLRLCLELRPLESGKLFIYHPFVQGSGTDLISAVLSTNGFTMVGNRLAAHSLCMHCDVRYGEHRSARTKGHEFTPVNFTVITGGITKSAAEDRLRAFNRDDNVRGEHIKIVVGSRAMRESHTLKACKHVVITHEPSSISEMVQIIGRAVRKRAHDLLPAVLRTVRIYVLTTSTQHCKIKTPTPSISEETSYEAKVKQYMQINQIERIMYDVSLDYLINFRFKLRETPPLIGDAYELDWTRQHRYKETLTQTYADLRNGVAVSGIHTNRFNVFHFDGEVRTTAMIIKRILLDHQPVITIRQLMVLVREPPFRVEYNTQLISDEAIAVAIRKILYMPHQLRMRADANMGTLAGALFDMSSDIIDKSGELCKIVCVGSDMCMDSLLMKRSFAAIKIDDNSILDCFHTTVPDKATAPIDLLEMFGALQQSTSVEDIIEDRGVAWAAASSSDLKEDLANLPDRSHELVATWIVELAAAAILSGRIRKTDIELAHKLAQAYTDFGVMFTIADLRDTSIYDRYKKYDRNTGASWASGVAKPFTADLPVAFAFGEVIHAYVIADRSWLKLNSIPTTNKNNSLLYDFYMYEERAPQSLEVSIKIRFINDTKARGITMIFLPTDTLKSVASKLKVDVSGINRKETIVARIRKAVDSIQNKNTKRILYKLFENPPKKI